MNGIQLNISNCVRMVPDCVKTPGARKLAAMLGFFALSARSAGFIFLATPIGITGGLIYGACAYATDKLFKSVFKVSILDDKAWKKQKVLMGMVQCVATAVIVKLAITGLLGVQLSLGASILIPFTSAIAIGAGVYWIARWTLTAAAIGFCALTMFPSLARFPSLIMPLMRGVCEFVGISVNPGGYCEVDITEYEVSIPPDSGRFEEVFDGS